MTSPTALQDIPGVGPRTQVVLEELGIHQIADLQGRDPAEMYLTLCEQEHMDRCVLYVFRCAVYFAETPRPDGELLKWWSLRVFPSPH